MVIMNQEEKNVNKNSSEDADNVNYVTLVTALGGARLHKFNMLQLVKLGKAGITDPIKTCTVVVRLDMNMFKAMRWVSSEVGPSSRESALRIEYLKELNESNNQNETIQDQYETRNYCQAQP